ncbi:hypothetical protein BJ875DRAFT_55362 [Amylocarpus encephaloides]|uniref:Uncharacterized protein n=1 Tax=Amylocarpus encephaloides TaxID=45428 RepID=A0A9P8C4H1_9HELO|nr:hypothetical protein BJ875DRAFT_55362 [Amylocarpus encephaloides]
MQITNMSLYFAALAATLTGVIATPVAAPKPVPTFSCSFGQYTCEGKSIYQCNGGWKLVSNCGGSCRIINGSPFCL